MRRLLGLALVAVALTACGTSNHLPVAGTAPSPSPTRLLTTTPSPTPPTPPAPLQPAPTATPSPSIDCSVQRSAPLFNASPPSQRSLALISTDAYATTFIVRDITDIDHPFTVSNLTHQVSYATKFVNAAEVSDVSSSTGLVRMPLSGSPTTVVAACGTRQFAWSPDGTAAAYLSDTASPKVQALHLVASGVDTVVDSMPAFDGGAVGCESRAQGCWDTWQFSLLYSPNGAYISCIQQLGGYSIFRIWTSSGKVLKSVDGSSATMQVWSGDTLYWRDRNGVESWRDGVETLAFPGLHWVRPHASPSSGPIVFATLDTAYVAHVELLDLQTRQVREVASSRSEPAFLTSRFLWYGGDKPCSGPCYVPERDGQYIYDLQTRTESPSIITYLWDVWPHAA